MKIITDRKWLFVLCLWLLLGVLWACENSPQDNFLSKQAKGESPSVSIAITGAPPNWLTMLAFERGYCEKAGLNATPKFFQSGKRAIQGMFAGDIDIASVADVPIAKYSLERKDFAIFSTIGTTYNDNKVAARKDRDITSPEDLHGKKIATQGNSAAHFFLHLFLMKNNIPTANIFINFAKIEDLPSMLCNGNVEAIVTRQPFLNQSLEQCGNEIIVFEEPGLFVKNFHLVAFKDFLNQNPVTVQKVLQAMLEAEQFARDHKKEAAVLLSKKLGLREDHVLMTMEEIELGLSLNQPLLRILADESRWLIEEKSLGVEVPNYLDFIWLNSLKAISTDAVTIIN